MTPLPAMLLNSVLVMIAVRTCLWLLSLARRDASSVDPFWGTGFVVVTWFTLTGTPAAQAVVAACHTDDGPGLAAGPARTLGCDGRIGG